MASMALEDFDLLALLGTGGFGKVLLARSKAAPPPRRETLYAMKVLDKGRVVSRNPVAHTMHELHVLATVRHPFLCRMHHVFEASGCLCMVMDLLPPRRRALRAAQEGLEV